MLEVISVYVATVNTLVLMFVVLTVYISVYQNVYQGSYSQRFLNPFFASKVRIILSC